MEHQLTRGCALVLTGPQGCGKTTLARQIAAAHGSYREIDATELDSPFRLGAALDGEPSTLIVEGAPAHAESLRRVKAMLTSDTVVAERKGMAPKPVNSPNFIFCTGDANPLNLGPDDRRFRVVRLG
ncbi:primase-helicase family protein [Thauera aromatica]|uniref:primase-helicase family protein n=1 Tax=Thauera aromatica TaxID=59405 RepID=UPI001FFD0519|nr:primase-helicase family protein [Thauera aromatica]MCK2095187.1 AAA family ATPase [Thauera aromatica]